jgi:hypothetical protein
MSVGFSVVYEETARNPKIASTHASSLFVVSSLNPKTRASVVVVGFVFLYVRARISLCVCSVFCVCGSDSGVRKKVAMEDAEVQAEGASSAPALASTQGRFSL